MNPAQTDFVDILRAERRDILNRMRDTQFTTLEDVAEVALLFAGFETNALTGQSLVVSHGWYMQ